MKKMINDMRECIAGRMLVILMVIGLMPAFAMAERNFTPVSMSLKPFDTTLASYGRKDLNGNACALVKMVLLMPEVAVEGNVIGDCEFHKGEYWIYLTPGTRKIKVKHDRYQPEMIDFKELGIDGVQSNCTYELVVEVKSSDPEEAKKLQEYAEELEALNRKLELANETDDHKFQRAMETRDIKLMKLLAEAGYEKAYLQLGELYNDSGDLTNAEYWGRKAIGVTKDSMLAKFLLRNINEKKEKNEKEKNSDAGRKKAIIGDLFD